MAPAPPTLEPELHYVIPTPHVPNSRLPIIIYRGVLKGFEYDDIIELMQRNGWKKGGQWKTYKTAHYHTNVHEGYAVISGSVRYLLGKGPTDEDSNEGGKNYGVEVSFEKDDVFILPAGVSHNSIESEGDFEYIGFYVKDAPKWDMNYCKDDAEVTEQKKERSWSVPIPETDPVYGAEGPLPRVWREVSSTV